MVLPDWLPRKVNRAPTSTSQSFAVLTLCYQPHSQLLNLYIALVLQAFRARWKDQGRQG